jgi:hypothetical protein
LCLENLFGTTLNSYSNNRDEITTVHLRIITIRIQKHMKNRTHNYHTPSLRDCFSLSALNALNYSLSVRAIREELAHPALPLPAPTAAAAPPHPPPVKVGRAGHPGLLVYRARPFRSVPAFSSQTTPRLPGSRGQPPYPGRPC